MSSSLRFVASGFLIILLLGTPEVLLGQSRGRTSGRTDDARSSRQTDTRSSDEPSARTRSARQTTKDDTGDKAKRTVKDAPASRERSSRSSGAPAATREAAPAKAQTRTQTPSNDARSRSTGRMPARTTDESDRGTRATSREDRQRATTPRPTRERAPETTNPGQDRSVRTPAATERSGRTVAPSVRGREADRAASRGRVVAPPTVVVTKPHRVRTDAAWPWVWRRQHDWSPRYRYRQRVVIDAGWLGRRHNDFVEVETTYRHRLRRADNRRAEIDVFIERIAVYDRGRFIGEVDRIPNDLARMRAYVYRSGQMKFDREIFLVGSRRDGFELVSTRYYDNYVLNAYNQRHGYKAGYLDFRRDRVVPIRRSKFFRPGSFAGYVPLSLLPDDHRWLLDYGRDSITGYYYDSNDARRWDDDSGWDHRGWQLSNYSISAPGDDRLEREYRREITTNGGAVIQLQREEVLEMLYD